MSGGHFNYAQHHFHDIAEEIRRVIETNDCEELNEYGDHIGRGYDQSVIDKFKEAERYCRIAYIYAQRVDWLLSCDDGEDNFAERLDKELEEFNKNKDLDK